MEAGNLNGRSLDLIDAMIESADETISDKQVAEVERTACPTCGSCSGMFTANSMNSLNEAIGLALPGNGTIVATHVNREKLFIKAAAQIVENCYKYYRDGDESVLPRSIATRNAFLNAMTLDIAMGGRYRSSISQITRTLQSRSQLTLSYSGCKSCRRHSIHYEFISKTGIIGHPCASSRWSDFGTGNRPICHRRVRIHRRSCRTMEKRTR